MNPLQPSRCPAGASAIVAILTIAATLALLAGCGSASARVRGVAPLNLNDSQESTPVDVRFFQLADDGAFRRATFDALWVDAGKTLGADLLAPPVVKTVFPGSRNDQPSVVGLGSLDGRTRFIGIMGLYRRTDGSDRRTLVLPVDRIGSVVVELSGYAVALSSDGAPLEDKEASSQPRSAPARTAKGGG